MTSTSGNTPGPATGRLHAALAHAERLWRHAERYVHSQLVWSNIYRVTSYVRSALWIIPLFSIVLVLAIAPSLRMLDLWLGWRLAGLGVAGAQALYQTVITLTLSFIVFTFGSLLVAIQVASGQLTPRIIATTLLRDNVVRYSVGLFVFTLIFSVMALDRLETKVHELVALVAASLGIACMATFLFLIDYAARLLRPVSIVGRVGEEGVAVIKSVYPKVSGDADMPGGPPAQLDVRRVVSHAGHSGIVLAVDLVTVINEARRADGVVEFVPQVGDFVASEEPLFVLHGGAAAIDDRVLQAAVAFGSERTMEQDPLFSFRIIADIALKALSPAINDPTTAVLAIDQIQRLLRVVGKRQLRGETISDERGHCRVIYRTPNWEDFVHLACTEIRNCGAGNVQIARRLRAMLDNLITSLPPHRHQALEDERRRLDLALGPLYALPDDLALARIPDSQGLGGSAGGRATVSKVRG
jgi:uncharacterized membrane protein